MMADQLDFDFGTPVSVIGTAEEFLDLPAEVAKRREEREAAKPVPVEVPEVKGEAKAALEAETHGPNDVSFEFDGETYWVPLVDEWDLEVFECQEDGKMVGLVRTLLGEEQYAKFKSEVDPDRAHGLRRKKKRTLPDLLEIFGAATKATGTQPGE